MIFLPHYMRAENNKNQTGSLEIYSWNENVYKYFVPIPLNWTFRNPIIFFKTQFVKDI